MFRRSCVLLFLLLAILTLEPIAAAKSGKHRYPSGGGLSGGGHHTSGLSGGSSGYHTSGSSYPAGSGLSGGGRNPGSLSGGGAGYPSGVSYPGSSGLSGSGSSKYPSPGGSYPSSGGSHPSSGGSYPSTGVKPSGGHSYPSGGGLSGSGSGSYGKGSNTVVHHHYHYTPPQQIRYVPVHGGPAVSYPVYRGSPPTYVYQYKDSGSKYGTLLAGLALFNLGALAGTAYGRYTGSSNTYKSKPGEVCKFAVKKDNGDYEETKINCEIISSFIFEEQGKVQAGGTNSTVVTTVTNVTTVNNNGVQQTLPLVTVGNVTYMTFPNGTLVPLNNSSPNTTVNGSSVTSSVTTTVTNTTTVSNALDVKGSPIAVTPGMQCFLIWTTPSTNRRKSIPCSVLQSYATQSLRLNSSDRKYASAFTISAAILILLSAY